MSKKKSNLIQKTIWCMYSNGGEKMNEYYIKLFKNGTDIFIPRL